MVSTTITITIITITIYFSVYDDSVIICQHFPILGEVHTCMCEYAVHVSTKLIQCSSTHIPVVILVSLDVIASLSLMYSCSTVITIAVQV